jgi:succinyl-CoA synthetase beta subunit
MNIHEYQAKQLLAKFGIGVPAGYPARTVKEAVEGAKQLPGPLYVVKAQIHAGGPRQGQVRRAAGRGQGRGAAGQVDRRGRGQRARDARQHAGDRADRAAGKQVNRLYVTDGVDIAKEYYLALLVDRASSRIALIVSTEGGMSIEDVATTRPRRSPR